METGVQHLQVGTGAAGGLPGGELADIQELLRASRAGALSGLNSTYQELAPCGTHAELNVIVAAELAAINALSVDEGAVAAALVDDEGSVGFADELRVLARDAGIGHHQIAIGPASNRKREVIEHKGAAVATFDHHPH